MKKVVLITVFTFLSITSYGQYRWEISGGPTFSKINLDNVDSEIGTGFYFNVGYGYLMDPRAKTSIVFSIDLLQRSSEIETRDDVKALQVGFNPKFRLLFNRGKDRFRPFINVGPSLRLNTNVEIGGEELDTDSYEQLIIGGVYGAGFSLMIGEMFDIFGEFGVMNDFTDNIVDVKSKFFDFYARVGVRFRIYDARR